MYIRISYSSERKQLEAHVVESAARGERVEGDELVITRRMKLRFIAAFSDGRTADYTEKLTNLLDALVAKGVPLGEDHCHELGSRSIGYSPENEEAIRSAWSDFATV